MAFRLATAATLAGIASLLVGLSRGYRWQDDVGEALRMLFVK